MALLSHIQKFSLWVKKTFMEINKPQNCDIRHENSPLRGLYRIKWKEGPFYELLKYGSTATYFVCIGGRNPKTNAKLPQN